MAACGAGLTRRTSVRGVVLGALGWLLRLSLVLGRGEPSPKPGPHTQGAGSRELCDARCSLGCVGPASSHRVRPAPIADRPAGPPPHNSLRDASLPLQPCMPAPAPTYHRTHASTAWLPARKGFRGRHRQHPRHGTAKLPPITACPLEPTPRPFALLNDRPRQRMRGASTLDVTTAPPKEGSKAFPFSFSRDPPEQTRRAAGELSDATLHVPVKLDTLRLRKSLGSALVVGRPSSPPHDALQRPVPLSSTSSAFSLRL